MTENGKDELPPWGTPRVPPQIQEAEIKKQLHLLDSLRAAVAEGTVAAISCVVVRGNFVPEHAFSLVPYSAAILLAGMDMAMDDLKSNARRVMMGAPATGGEQGQSATSGTTSSPPLAAAPPDEPPAGASG